MRFALVILVLGCLIGCTQNSGTAHGIELGMNSADVSAQIQSDLGNAPSITNDAAGGSEYKGEFKLFSAPGSGKLTFGKDKKLFDIDWSAKNVSDSIGNGVISSLKQKWGEPYSATGDTMRWMKNSTAILALYHSGSLVYSTSDMKAMLDYVK